jgi:very-short-patch-repair endonuclease
VTTKQALHAGSFQEQQQEKLLQQQQQLQQQQDTSCAVSWFELCQDQFRGLKFATTSVLCF